MTKDCANGTLKAATYQYYASNSSTRQQVLDILDQEFDGCYLGLLVLPTQQMFAIRKTEGTSGKSLIWAMPLNFILPERLIEQINTDIPRGKTVETQQNRATRSTVYGYDAEEYTMQKARQISTWRPSSIVSSIKKDSANPSTKHKRRIIAVLQAKFLHQLRHLQNSAVKDFPAWVEDED